MAQSPTTFYGYQVIDPWVSSAPSQNINNSYFGYRVARGFAPIGDDNSAFGYLSSYQLKLAYRNSSFGSQAGYGNQLGNDNASFGAFSGYLNQSGSSNVNIGSYAGYSGFDKGFNVLIGANCGKNNNTSGSTFIGFNSGFSNTTGANNVFMGYHSGYSNTIGSANVFLGYLSGYSNTGASGNNIFIGQQSGYFNTTGSSNVYIGHGAGLNSSAGTGNTYLGFQSGMSAIGTGNVFIGFNSGRTETGSNKLYITNNDNTGSTVPLIYGDFSTRKIAIGLPNTFAATDRLPVTVTSGGSTTNVSNYKLFVKEGILTEAVLISPFSGWADYVFEQDYQLKPLKEVEKYIKDKGHLPNVPSAKEIEKTGIELKTTAILQQEKIEELTLYLIQQDKDIQFLKEQVNLLMNKK